MKKIRIRLTTYCNYGEENNYDLLVTEEQINILNWLMTEDIFDGEYERVDEIQVTDLTT